MIDSDVVGKCTWDSLGVEKKVFVSKRSESSISRSPISLSAKSLSEEQLAVDSILL